MTSLLGILVVLAVVLFSDDFSAAAESALAVEEVGGCFFGEEVNLRLFEAALLGLLAVLLILLLCFLGDSALALLCLPSTIAGFKSRPPSLSLGVATADAAPPKRKQLKTMTFSAPLIH